VKARDCVLCSHDWSRAVQLLGLFRNVKQAATSLCQCRPTAVKIHSSTTTTKITRPFCGIGQPAGFRRESMAGQQRDKVAACLQALRVALSLPPEARATKPPVSHKRPAPLFSFCAPSSRVRAEGFVSLVQPCFANGPQLISLPLPYVGRCY
jgi:hypothetical protein